MTTKINSKLELKGGKNKMNKTIILSVLIAFIVLGSAFAVAQTANQTAQVMITADLSLGVFPNPLVFPAVNSDAFSIAESQLTAGSSDLQVIGITVSPTIGDVFQTSNMQVSVNNDGTYEDLASMTPFNIAATTSKTIALLLNVPMGTPTGAQEGTITYTVIAAN